MRLFKPMASALIVVVGASLLLTPAATAAPLQFGYFNNNAGANAKTAESIGEAGHIPVQINNLTTFDLSTVDVLWVLNQSNGGYPGISGNEAKIADFVQGGGVLSFHDRRVTEAANILPGAGGINFVRSFGTNIDVLTAGTTVTDGPGGMIDDTTLDGGNFSNHGFADLASLPVDAIPIFNRDANGQEIVDFFFPFGGGFVYYSTVPLDFYFAGSGTNPPADEFREIYGPNEAAFQGQLAIPIPEPTSLAIWGLVGLGGAAYGWRRKRRKGTATNEMAA